MQRRGLTLLAMIACVVWLFGTRGAPSWFHSLEQAQAAAGGRVVVAVVHDPERTAAQEAFLLLQRAADGDSHLGQTLVLVDLPPDAAPEAWGLGATGFTVRVMEEGGDLVAQRHGILSPESFLAFLEGVLDLRSTLRRPPLENASDVRRWLSEARSLRELECLDQARDSLEKVLADPAVGDSEAAEAHAWLALDQACRGQAVRAREHLQWLNENPRPQDLDPVRVLARAHVAHVEREDEESERLLRQLLQDWPQSVLIVQARALLLDWFTSPPH